MAVYNGRKTLASAGTRERLATDTFCKKVIITAMVENTGIIVVGGSDVVASQSTRQGIPLYPANSIEIATSNLNKVYLDAEVNGEGVTYIYIA
jgi:hypothetical protein